MRYSLLFALALLAGCEPCPHYNRLQVVSYSGQESPKPYGTVTPYTAPEDVKRPYTVIGLMSCEGSAGDEAAILKAMLYRASDMGADAIILNPKTIGSESISGNKLDVRMGWASMIGSGSQRAYRATAIRFNKDTSN